MAASSPSAHWDAVYGARPTEELGWYQPSVSTLSYVVEHSKPTDSVIDIGGGDSRLVDGLAVAGYRDVAVLDLSEIAIDRARARLGDQAHWVVGDVLDWRPERTWDVWHDRAVFHFLVDQADQAVYIDRLRAALAPDGRLVMATFAPEGPDQCAGLRAVRYDVEGLVAVFGDGFELVDHGSVGGGGGVGDHRPYTVAVFVRS